MSRLRRSAAALALCVPLVAGAFDKVEYERFRKSPVEPVSSSGWYTPTVDIGKGPGAPLRTAKPGERSVEAAALDGALAYAQDKNTYGLIVAHRGAIQLEYYKDGFGPERLLDSQSMHKPLAAIVTMAAVADGRLSLDDPLAKFIPRWHEDARGAITVRDVLYMQTGLVEPQYEEKFDNPAFRMFITTRLEDAVLALQLEEPPGTHFRSHYAATQLLQFVIERATGKRYADYLRERLWSPLGGGLARVRLDRPHGNAQVFCCLQARPRDWLRVGLMLAGGGQYDGRTVLPPDAIPQLTTPSTMNPNFAMQQIWLGSPYSRVRMADSRNPKRGLPMSAPFLADDVFYLEGRGGQRVYVVPSRELVVVRQGEIRMEWDDAAFLNGLIAGVDRNAASATRAAADAR
jgi:CubicO group peptidase (beta-lactamase class C family)